MSNLVMYLRLSLEDDVNADERVTVLPISVESSVII